MAQSMAGCAMILAGAVLAGAGACVRLGNRKMRRIAVFFPLAGGALILGGLGVNRAAYRQIADFVNSMDLPASHIEEHLRNLSLQWPEFANTAWTAGGVLLLAGGLAAALFAWKKKCPEVRPEMEEKYKLFIMFLPVLILSFVFAYLPIYGWRYGIMGKLDKVAADYEINERETALAVLDDGVPQVVKLYLASKKLEGLSDLTIKMYLNRLRIFFDAVRKEPQNVEANDITD